MKVKRSIFNLPMSIIGLTIEQAKISCLVEGYVLRLKDCNIHNFLSETYFVTVYDIDSDGKILNAKYGK
jgi:hypothetical protein